MSLDFNKNISIAPLVVLRMLFGLIMSISLFRFILKGWVYDCYILPDLHFKFYGFSWIESLGQIGMYVIFILMIIACIMIMAGYFYRIAVLFFFLAFTYTELIDVTYYLNHYYFISLISFLLIFLPADRYFSIRVWIKPEDKIFLVPSWMIYSIKLMLAVLYCFAGLAKINPDWLFNAMPLILWLPPHAHLPIIGPFLLFKETAFIMSWAGCFYDLFIVFFLLNNKTRGIAYLFVIIFHVSTAMLFQIGMFPYIMILLTLIFFSEGFHQKLIKFISGLMPFGNYGEHDFNGGAVLKSDCKLVKLILCVFFIFQLSLPLRYLIYPGNLFWTEEGYRFSWRVMLMEKSGYAQFVIMDKATKGKINIDNSEYLTPLQEKMMSTQPDLILQYAHFLRKEYEGKKILDSIIIKDPSVFVNAYASLNGRPNQQFIDPNIDLSRLSDSFKHKDWILKIKSNI